MVLRAVVDERRRYSEYTGLLVMRRDGIVEHGWKYDGFDLRAKGPTVVSRKFVGMVGFYAGPAVHIVDELALADPLLARIPGGDSRSLMGHLTRVIPEGYLDTVTSGRNQIVDADLARYYDALHEVVSAPLWSAHRLRTLVRFVAGGYDRYLNAYLERHKGDPAPEIVARARVIH
jgi:arabinofuranosyltransferase